MRIVDGPDEVHRNQIGKMELEKYKPPRARKRQISDQRGQGGQGRNRTRRARSRLDQPFQPPPPASDLPVPVTSQSPTESLTWPFHHCSI